jgi:hypothetical protein
MLKRKNNTIFLLLLFFPKQKKSKAKNCFFQLSQGVSFGTLVFLFRALVLLLRLTSPRTATSLKTALTLYESWVGTLLFLFIEVNFLKNEVKIIPYPRSLRIGKINWDPLGEES